MHVARRTCEMRSVERTIDMFLCVLVQCNEKRGKMSIVFERKRAEVQRHKTFGSVLSSGIVGTPFSHEFLEIYVRITNHNVSSICQSSEENVKFPGLQCITYITYTRMEHNTDSEKVSQDITVL